MSIEAARQRSVSSRHINELAEPAVQIVRELCLTLKLLANFSSRHAI